MKINQKAVSLARQAVADKSVYVAGSIGPTGLMLKPFGPLDPMEAEESYKEQANSLAQAGVDILVIETQFDISEAVAAVKGVRSTTSLPLVVSFSYDRGLRTMMGVKPSQAATEMESLVLMSLELIVDATWTRISRFFRICVVVLLYQYGLSQMLVYHIWKVTGTLFTMSLRKPWEIRWKNGSPLAQT